MNLDGAEKEVSKASKSSTSSKKSRRSLKLAKESEQEQESSKTSRKSRKRGDGPADYRTEKKPEEGSDARQQASSDVGPQQKSSKEPTTGAADVPGKDDAHPTLSQFQTSERRDVTASEFQPLVLAQPESTNLPSSNESQALPPTARDDSGTAPSGVPVVRTTASDEHAHGTDKELEPTTRTIRHATLVQAGVEAVRAVKASGLKEGLKVRALSVRTQHVVEQPTQGMKPSGFKISDVTEKRVVIKGCVGVSCLLLAFILTAVWAFGARSQKRHYVTCDTLACDAYSKRLRESINSSVNPCDSFTHYVCDGWNSRYEASVNDDALLASLTRMYHTVRDLNIPKSGQSMLQSTAAFYMSCACIGKGVCSDLRSVFRLLQEANVVWPVKPRHPDLLRTLLHVSIRLKWSGIISIDVFAYGRQKAVYLRPSTEFYMLARKSNEQLRSIASRKRYFEFLKRSFMAAHSTVVHGELVTFEDTQKVDQKMFNVLWNKKFVQPIKQLNHSYFYTFVPGLTQERWNEALQDYGLLNPEDERIVFYSDTIYFVNMFMKLWKEYGEEEMHLLLSWCTVQVAALFADQELLFNFYGTEQKMKLGYRAFCFSKTFVVSGEALLHRFSDATLPKDIRPEAHELILDVRHALHRQLLSWRYYNENLTVVHDWNSTALTLHFFEEQGGENHDALSEAKDVRRKSLVDMGDSLVANWQLAARALLLSPESQLLSKVIQELDLYMLHLDTGEPDMSLLPYAFSFPYFDHGALSVLNYAGIGSRVAEALTQLFLSAYFLHRIPGKAFLNHAKCMENATSNNEIDGNSFVKYLEPLSLKTALYAYRRRDSGKDVRVSGLEFLTPEQLFFVAACYVRCKRTTNPPGVDDGQCDMTLMHVAEFAEAFKCAPDSRMNPSHRCELL